MEDSSVIKKRGLISTLPRLPTIYRVKNDATDKKKEPREKKRKNKNFVGKICWPYHDTSTGTDDSQIRAEIDVWCVFNDNIETVSTYRLSSLFQIAFLSVNHTQLMMYWLRKEMPPLSISTCDWIPNERHCFSPVPFPEVCRLFRQQSYLNAQRGNEDEIYFLYFTGGDGNVMSVIFHRKDPLWNRYRSFLTNVSCEGLSF